MANDATAHVYDRDHKLQAGDELEMKVLDDITAQVRVVEVDDSGYNVKVEILNVNVPEEKQSGIDYSEG